MQYQTNKQREDIYWRLLVALGPPPDTLKQQIENESFRTTRTYLQNMSVYCQHNRDGISVSAYKSWWDQQQTKALQLLNRSTQHD